MPNFGELKTAVFSQIPAEHRGKISTFEFGEALDAAQRLFAIVLPAEAIPEIVIDKFIDRSSDIGATRILPLPEDFLRLEDIQFATTRDSGDIPLRKTARIVSPEEFMELENNTTEKIASVYNNLIHLWPEPCAAVADKPAAVKAIYRKRPKPYLSTSGVIQNAARLHLQQDSESRRTFYCRSYVDMAQKPFDYWGLDTNELVGGYAYIGAEYVLAYNIGPLYVTRIVMAWETDVDNFGMIRVSSDDAIPYSDASPGVGFTFLYCYLAQRQSFGRGDMAIEAEDFDFPDMSANWHSLMVDYALARLEVRWNPQSSQARMQRVFQTLAAAGAKLDYTKEN